MSFDTGGRRKPASRADSAPLQKGDFVEMTEAAIALGVDGPFKYRTGRVTKATTGEPRFVRVYLDRKHKSEEFLAKFWQRSSVKREPDFRKWAMHYDSCVACGSTELPHNSKGHCTKCYPKVFRRPKR